MATKSTGSPAQHVPAGYNSMLAYFADTDVAVAMQINTDQSNIEEHFEALARIITSEISRDKPNFAGSR